MRYGSDAARLCSVHENIPFAHSKTSDLENGEGNELCLLSCWAIVAYPPRSMRHECVCEGPMRSWNQLEPRQLRNQERRLQSPSRCLLHCLPDERYWRSAGPSYYSRLPQRQFDSNITLPSVLLFAPQAS
jgi:hypothetical protein